MHANTQKAIIAHIQRLEANVKIKGTVKVVVNKNNNRIDISYDNRKYIGRLRFQLQDDRFVGYFMDKDEGKIASSEARSSKSAYLAIESVAQARDFVKMYILLTGLAAMKRNRA